MLVSSLRPTISVVADAVPFVTLRRSAVALLLVSVAAFTCFAHDTEKSAEELTRAAELGDAQAQHTLGHRYLSGYGVEEDDTVALKWYRRSAEQGFAPAQSALGLAYAQGHVTDQDFTQAAAWCRLGAEQGNSDGQVCMAWLYAGGCGVEQDYTESVRWIRLAADQGVGLAEARLGDMYANGEGGVEHDPVEADRWYRRALEPDIYHPMRVGGTEIYSGRPFLTHLATLAVLYQDGTGVPHNDVVAAYKWLEIVSRWRVDGSGTTRIRHESRTLIRDGYGTMIPEGAKQLLDDLAMKMTREQVADARRAADAFLESYRIGSYEAWRRMAHAAAFPKEAGELHLFGVVWWYSAATLWYPMARWWWRITAAVRATISPPVIPDALMTTASSGTPGCTPGKTS